MHYASQPAVSSRADPPKLQSDEALLGALGRGDPGAGGAFVRRFQGRVYGLARSIVGDPTEAEDVAQEVLSRAWRHARTYDSRRGSVTTWVLAMTRNLAVDILRRHAAEPADPRAVIFLAQPARGPLPDEVQSIAERADGVRAALWQIPVEQRRALIFAAFHGYTAREIGETEAIPLGTAKTRIRSGLIKMRALLREDGTPIRPGTSCVVPQAGTEGMRKLAKQVASPNRTTTNKGASS